MPIETLLVFLTLVAGFYMAWNIGANDVANAMGTSVGSGALTLGKAVLVAAFLEFSGAFFFGSHVSATLQNGIIRSELFAPTPLVLVYGMLASLIGTGIWLQIASYCGWPVSTTHSIVGGMVGFGVVIGGVEAIYWENIGFIVSSWVLSPLFGGILSYILFTTLRKKVLYTADPVAQAKKLTPILAFIVVMMLALIMIYKGLENIDLDFSFLTAVGLSTLAGLIGALISYLALTRVKDVPTPQVEHPYGAEVSNELDKATKHLHQVQVACRGEAKFRVSQLLNELNELSLSLKKTADRRSMSHEYTRVEKIFSYLQIMSACLMAFAHGANDVANAIGPLSAAMGILETGSVAGASQPVPVWALALGGIGIVVGLATWGWRVIETIGRRITELTPTRGFAAEFGAATTILIASRLGLPISTTHTLVGSVIGVGCARGMEALDLSMTRDIVVSWFITLPICGAITIGIFYLLQFTLSSLSIIF